VRGPGRKKTLFGTSFPTVGHRHTINQLGSLDLSDEIVANLMGNNARRVFKGIDALG
jgi:predicted TIM-barrel fold metal-dependent hydrolase